MPAKKELLSAKTSSPTWYEKFESFMVDQKFHKTQANHFVFVKKFDGEDFLTLPLYVDDMPIVGQDLKKNASLKRALSKSLQ